MSTEQLTLGSAMSLNKMGYFESQDRPRSQTETCILTCLKYIADHGRTASVRNDLKLLINETFGPGPKMYTELCTYIEEIFFDMNKPGHFGLSTRNSTAIRKRDPVSGLRTGAYVDYGALLGWLDSFHMSPLTKDKENAEVARFLKGIRENDSDLKEVLSYDGADRSKHDFTFLKLLDDIQTIESTKLYGTIGHSTHAIVDDNSFIQLIAKGYIPLSRNLINDHGYQPVTAARAFLCAKCVYMAYLYSQYRKTQKDTIKKLEREKKQLKSKRRSYRAAKLKLEVGPTPLMKILITKKAMLSRVLNEIEENYKKTIDLEKTTLSTPYLLWKHIKREPDPPVSHDSRVTVSFSTEKELYEVGQADVPTSKFTNLTRNYEDIVVIRKNIPPGLCFTDSQVETTKYELCWGAKKMIDAGVNPEIRYKFYRMATSFAIAPFTMFKSMAMNIALMGPPGTGKSTLAKKIGEFAYAVGWLTTNDPMMPLPSELISDVRGETAANTRSYLNASLGRMLFIDEAYALTPKGDPSGKEFADELTEFLSNHQGMLMVMVAGYVDEMTNDFFSANVGLPRRFPTRIILGKKTPRACFNAFMLQLTERIGANNIGALNVTSMHNSQTPFFLSQAAIWIPIFHMLLGERYNDKNERDDDDPVNLLSYYYADIALIAEIYTRYLMSEGLFGQSDGINRGVYNNNDPFARANVIKHVLNDWLNCKHGENTRVEGVVISDPRWFPFVDLGARKSKLKDVAQLQAFKEYYNEQGKDSDKNREAYKVAQHLLDKKIYLWPVNLTDTKATGEVHKYLGLEYGPSVSLSFEAVDPDGGEKASNATYTWIDTEDKILEVLGGQSVSANALIHHHRHQLEDQKLERDHEEVKARLFEEIKKSVTHSGMQFNPDEENIDKLKDILDQINTANETKTAELKKKIKHLEAAKKDLEKRVRIDLPYNNQSVVNINVAVKAAEEKAAIAEKKATASAEMVQKMKKKLSEAEQKNNTFEDFKTKLTNQMKEESAKQKTTYLQHIKRQVPTEVNQREIFDKLNTNKDNGVTFYDILEQIFNNSITAKEMTNKSAFDPKTRAKIMKEIVDIHDKYNKYKNKHNKDEIKQKITEDQTCGKILKEKFHAIDKDANKHVEWKEVEEYMGKKPIVKNEIPSIADLIERNQLLQQLTLKF